VPSHFSQQSAAKLASQARLKEESPSKAGLNKRKKLKNKRRRSLRTYTRSRQRCTTPGYIVYRVFCDMRLDIASIWLQTGHFVCANVPFADFYV